MQIYKNKSMCTGCTACSNICPKKAISMNPDDKGFLYPEVDMSLCVQCGKCKAVCLTYEENKIQNNDNAFYFINENPKTLLKSSSGGAFSKIAENILFKGGSVCGAVFNHTWDVIHKVATDDSGVAEMRGSKYVQSDLQNVFRKIEELLKCGKTVLFTGSPCQVVGLQKYLGKHYEKLILVDFICSSIPSPEIFRTYLKTLQNQYGEIKEISFRDKSEGWKNYSVKIVCDQKTYLKNHKEDMFMKGFLGGLYSRSCCHNCPVKERVGYWSDITIGDLWGAEEILPQLDFYNGISVVISHTERGLELIKEMQCNKLELEEVYKHNQRYQCSHAPYKDLNKFWDVYKKKGLEKAYQFVYSPSLIKRVKEKCKRIVIRRK